MNNAVDKIIAKINDDMNMKLREFQTEVDKKIEEIRRVEYGKWELEKDKMEREGKKEAENIKRLHISRAHLEGKRELLEAREEVMKKVITSIKNNARKLPKYDEYLRQAVEDAKIALGNELVLLCAPEDEAKIKKIASEVIPTARIELGTVKYGGIIAKTFSGERSVDYSIEAFIERNLNEIRKKIVEKLFEGEYA